MKTKKNVMWWGIALITVLVTVVCILWKYCACKWFFNECGCIGQEFRLEYLVMFLSVIWEELLWRLAPILIASIAIALSKPKWLKYILYIFFTIIIIGLQIWFGSGHYNWNESITAGQEILNEGVDHLHLKLTIFHGVPGLFFAFEYICVMLLVLKTRFADSKRPLIAILIANAAGCLAAYIVHYTENSAGLFIYTC